MPMIFLMLVKKFIYQLMAAGPILLLGLIAIHSRAKFDAWQFTEYGPDTSSRIYAYIDPIKAVRNRFVYKDEYDAQEVHEAIEIWLAEYRAGKLQDIYPVTTVLEGQTGVYQQIVTARHRLLYRARDQADIYFRDEEYVKAAELFTDIIEVANIAKFGEFSILAESSGTQSDALLRLVELSPFLSPEHRDSISERINQLDDPSRSLTHTVSRISTVYRFDLLQQGRSTAIIEAARSNHSLASAENLDSMRIEEWRLMSTVDRALIPLYARSRMAYLNQQKFDSTRALALSALQATEPTEVTPG